MKTTPTDIALIMLSPHADVRFPIMGGVAAVTESPISDSPRHLLGVNPYNFCLYDEEEVNVLSS
jgi:hypothetical protein